MDNFYYCWLNPKLAGRPEMQTYFEARAIIIEAKDENEAKNIYQNADRLKRWLIPQEMKYFEAIQIIGEKEAEIREQPERTFYRGDYVITKSTVNS